MRSSSSSIDFTFLLASPPTISLDPSALNTRAQIGEPFEKEGMVAFALLMCTAGRRLKAPQIQTALEGLKLGGFEVVGHDFLFKGVSVVHLEGPTVWHP